MFGHSPGGGCWAVLMPPRATTRPTATARNAMVAKSGERCCRLVAITGDYDSRRRFLKADRGTAQNFSRRGQSQSPQRNLRQLVLCERRSAGLPLFVQLQVVHHVADSVAEASLLGGGDHFPLE